LAQQTQKYRLQHIFGIGGIAGDPVCGPENQAMIGLKYPAEVRRPRKYPLLINCQLQIFLRR
jgi:hypothetical protein